MNNAPVTYEAVPKRDPLKPPAVTVTDPVNPALPVTLKLPLITGLLPEKGKTVAAVVAKFDVVEYEADMDCVTVGKLAAKFCKLI